MITVVAITYLVVIVIVTVPPFGVRHQYPSDALTNMY